MKVSGQFLEIPRWVKETGSGGKWERGELRVTAGAWLRQPGGWWPSYRESSTGGGAGVDLGWEDLGIDGVG